MADKIERDVGCNLVRKPPPKKQNLIYCSRNLKTDRVQRNFNVG